MTRGPIVPHSHSATQRAGKASADERSTPSLSRDFGPNGLVRWPPTLRCTGRQRPASGPMLGSSAPLCRASLETAASCRRRCHSPTTRGCVPWSWMRSSRTYEHRHHRSDCSSSGAFRVSRQARVGQMLNVGKVRFGRCARRRGKDCTGLKLPLDPISASGRSGSFCAGRRACSPVTDWFVAIYRGLRSASCRRSGRTPEWCESGPSSASRTRRLRC